MRHNTMLLCKLAKNCRLTDGETVHRKQRLSCFKTMPFFQGANVRQEPHPVGAVCKQAVVVDQNYHPRRGNCAQRQFLRQQTIQYYEPFPSRVWLTTRLSFSNTMGGIAGRYADDVDGVGDVDDGATVVQETRAVHEDRGLGRAEDQSVLDVCRGPNRRTRGRERKEHVQVAIDVRYNVHDVWQKMQHRDGS